MRGVGTAPERLRLLGEKIRGRREEMGLTRPALSEASGVSVATILRIENGYQDELKVSSVMAIADALSSDGESFKRSVLSALW
jgi:transcriptional regulator with XRE-family HTH domain